MYPPRTRDGLRGTGGLGRECECALGLDGQGQGKRPESGDLGRIPAPSPVSSCPEPACEPQ